MKRILETIFHPFVFTWDVLKCFFDEILNETSASQIMSDEGMKLLSTEEGREKARKMVEEQKNKLKNC